MENRKREDKEGRDKYPFEDQEYMGNIFGRKHTIYALIIILLFLGIALCRYLVIRPKQFITDPDNPIGGVWMQVDIWTAVLA